MEKMVKELEGEGNDWDWLITREKVKKSKKFKKNFKNLKI